MMRTATAGLVLLIQHVWGFNSLQTRIRPYVRLWALTERQMQFWEDVEDGLNKVEAVYNRRGLDIDRVRQFAVR